MGALLALRIVREFSLARVGVCGIIAFAVRKGTLRDVAQLGRALRSGRRSRRFKSCHPD